MPLGPEEIYLYARHAGFSPDQSVTMTAVAMAESGGVLTAHNASGEDSRGLWQVNLDSHPKFHGLDASDPLTNARMAFEVSGGGGDIGRWTVTHGDKGAPYLKYREQAEAASQAFGENGHGQWQPPANYHSAKMGAGVAGGPPPPADLPTGLPDDSNAEFTPAFPTGGQPGASTSPQMAANGEAAESGPAATDPDADIGQDSDGDGLLDRYEKAAGTDAQGLDSDNDGFTDQDEMIKFRTDATDFGSNPLGATGGTAPVGRVPASVPDAEPDPLAGADTSDVGVAPGDAASLVDTSDVGVAPGAAPAAGTAPGPVATMTAGPGPNLMPGPATVTTPPAAHGGGNKLDVFLDAAVAQDGDTYVFGAEVSTDAVDSDTWDCSELIEWAGAQAGVTIPDGSFNQYLHAKGQGAELTVEEALRTPGALLFKFSSTPVPGGGRPSTAHVGISLGDGRTMEARSSSSGVRIFEPDTMEWTHAGAVPELGTELSGDFGAGVVTEPVQPIQMGTDSDGDGLLDAYERLIGTDPFNTDTDQDGFIDSVEIHEHRSDPLDFTDNALTPGGGGGYRPPLTTDLHPDAGQVGQQTPGSAFDDVGIAPGSGSPFGQGGQGGGSGQGQSQGAGHDHSSHDHGQGGSQGEEPQGVVEEALETTEETVEETQETVEQTVEETQETVEETLETVLETGEGAVSQAFAVEVVEHRLDQIRDLPGIEEDLAGQLAILDDDDDFDDDDLDL